MKIPSAFLLFCFLVASFVHVNCKKEPIHNPCGDKVPCDNSQCIHKKQWCDGYADCRDESDEKFCKEISKWNPFATSHPNNCSSKMHFECDNGVCVPLATICDSYENCKDGSDEYDCGNDSQQESNEEDSSEEATSPSSFSIRTINEDIDNHDYSATKFTATTKITHAPSVKTFVSPSVPTRDPSVTDHYQHRLEEARKENTRTRKPYEGSRGNTPDPSEHRQHSDMDHTQFNQDHSSTLGIVPSEQTPDYQRPYSTPRYIHRRFSTSVAPPTDRRSSRQSLSPQHPTVPRRPDHIAINRKPIYSPALPAEPARNPNGRLSPFEREIAGEEPKAILTPFNFRTNYTRNFGNYYHDPVQNAEEWILSQRDSHYGWGEDTPRALIALSLVTNSFLAEIPENDYMRKSLATYLGIKLLRLRSNPAAISDSRLSLYINALLATCQDPRNLFGMDLTDMLLQRKNDLVSKSKFVNPFVYLTLCLVDAPTSTSDIQALVELLDGQYPDERAKDLRIFATTALACYQQKNEDTQVNRNGYSKKLKQIVKDAFSELLSYRGPDGSFGSKYSTALAAQALMSINADVSWEAEKTMDFLIQNLTESGSFGNMLATYYILPALRGRSLLHLRNTQCEIATTTPKPEFSAIDLLNQPGPKYSIYYTIKVGYPENSSLTIPLYLPTNTNFFKAMRVAEFLNPRFKFLYAVNNGDIDVHTIAGIPNDPERDYRWRLYMINGQDKTLNLKQPYTESIRDLIPLDNQEFVYWYLRS